MVRNIIYVDGCCFDHTWRFYGVYSLILAVIYMLYLLNCIFCTFLWISVRYTNLWSVVLEDYCKQAWAIYLSNASRWLSCLSIINCYAENNYYSTNNIEPDLLYHVKSSIIANTQALMKWANSIIKLANMENMVISLAYLLQWARYGWFPFI